MKKRILSLFTIVCMLVVLWPALPAMARNMGRVGEYQTISAGSSHTAVIKTDGSLWTWGNNDYGQLGDGTTEDRYTPVKIMDDIAAVSVGYDHTTVIKADGSFWAWGNNDYGQLGDGTTEDRYTPVKIMENISAVSAGASYTAVIKADGSLWGWGNNNYGQLGDGTTESRHVPVKIMDGVSAVSLGSSHTAAIKMDGSLWMWGYNWNGQLGNGTTENQYTPIKIMDNVSAVSVVEGCTAAIRIDGSLWMWGVNTFGSLGDGTMERRSTPVKIMDNVVAVSTGLHHTAAIKNDDSLWMWGYNGKGQLGDGTYENKLIPVKVKDNVVAVSAGQYYTAAMTIDGTVWGWGSNNYGQLGVGNTNDFTVGVVSMHNGAIPTEFNRGFDTTRDAWAFANAYESFGYNEGYYIPVSTWKDVYGSAVANFIENIENKKWGGNCYGMSSLAALIYNGHIENDYAKEINEVYRSTNLNGKSVLQPPDNNLTKLIERFQILQHSVEHSQHENILGSGAVSNMGVMNDLVNNQRMFEEVIDNIESNRKVYNLIVFTYSDDSKLIGHSMLTDTSRPIEKDGDWYKIYLYDCNYPYIDNVEGKNLYYSERYKYWNMRWVNINPKTGDWYIGISYNSDGEQVYAQYGKNMSKILFEDPNWIAEASCFTLDTNDSVFTSGSDISLYDTSGNILVDIDNGSIVNMSNTIGIIPDISYSLDQEKDTFRGRIILNQESLGSVGIQNASVTLLNNDRVIQASSDEYINCDIDGHDISITAENDAELTILAENINDRDSFDSITVKGRLEENEYISIVNNGNKDYDIATDSKNKFDVKASTENGESEFSNTELNDINSNLFETLTPVFTDLTDLTDKQKEAIEYAIQNYIMQGYADNTIRPFNAVTRAEFATIMCRYYDYSVDTKCNFDDSRDHWASQYIKACVDKGAINGIGNNKFDPDGIITYEQALKIFTILNGYTDGIDIEALGGYPDAYIRIANDINLNEGFTVTSVGQELPRVDVAMMIYNASEIKDYSINYDTGFLDDKSETNADNNLNNNSNVESSDILSERIKNKYDDISDFEYHNNDWALVKIDDKRGMIDKHGNEVIPVTYDYIYDCNDYRYYIVSKNEKNAVINDKNEIILDYQPKTVDLSPCSNADYIRYWDNQEDEIDVSAIITYDGEEIIPKGKYAYIRYYSDDCIVATKVTSLHPYISSAGIIDINGNTIMPFNYIDINRETDHDREIFEVTTEDGQSGIIDIHENIIVPIEYDYMFFWSSSLISVRNNNKYGIIDINNNTLIPIEYDDISIADKEKGLVIVEKQDSRKILTGILNKNNQVVIPIEYDKIHYESDSKIYVQKNGLWGMIDINNRIIINFKLECDYIYSDDHDKYFIAEKRDTCAIVTNTLEQVTDFEYSWADAARKCKSMNNDLK